MTVDIFLFFTKMKEKGFTLLKARLQDLLTSLKTKLVFKKPIGKPKCRVDEYGDKRWSLNGKLHREDGPAYEKENGAKHWWLHGKRHREDGPAVEHPDGSKGWYLNGKLHREDGPAREWADGSKAWWYLHNEKVHPETLVDLHLSRGVFCYYVPETDTLHFDESE